MEPHFSLGRLIRFFAMRSTEGMETLRTAPERLEALRRRENAMQKRIEFITFLLATCMLIAVFLMIFLAFAHRASPLTILVTRLLIFGCSGLFVGLTGLVLILNYQHELLCGEISNMMYWRSIDQAIDRRLSSDRTRRSNSRDTSQVHLNARSGQNSPNDQNDQTDRNVRIFENVPIQNFHNAQRVSTSPLVSNFANVSNVSNLRNDVLTIFRIRDLLPCIPAISKDKRWSISSEYDNCRTVMSEKELVTECSSCRKDLSEDKVFSKNVLKRRMLPGRSDATVKHSERISSQGKKQPILLDVSSSEKLDQQRSDQSIKIELCPMSTNLMSLQENIIETVLEGEGQEGPTQAKQQSSFMDNFFSKQTCGPSSDQSVGSKYPSRSTSLKLRQNDEYERFLNITKDIWLNRCTEQYESTNSPCEMNESESENILRTCRRIEEILKHQSTEFQLGGNVSESSDFLKINPDPNEHYMNKGNKNRDYPPEELNLPSSQPRKPIIYENQRKKTFGRKRKSAKKSADLMGCVSTKKTAETHKSEGLSQTDEKNSTEILYMNPNEISDDLAERKPPIVGKSLPKSVCTSQLLEMYASGELSGNPTEISKDFEERKTPPIVSTSPQKSVCTSQLLEMNASGELSVNPTEISKDFAERKTPIVTKSPEKNVGSTELLETNAAGGICLNVTECPNDFSGKIIPRMFSQSPIQLQNLTDENAFNVEQHRFPTSIEDPENLTRGASGNQNTEQMSGNVSE